MLSGLDGEHAKLLFLLGGHAQKAAAKKKKKNNLGSRQKAAWDTEH